MKVMLIISGIVMMWGVTLFLKFGPGIRYATKVEIEESLGAESRCVSYSSDPGHWICSYPVRQWECQQAGGFRTHCVPLNSGREEWP